ncbi:hypothetical protein FNU79_00580 [Deinococcus detaillensis]|uniref:Uncharacterized protein n=1 Tax=Deinococcus detaillensis TaxID=2592048 RepID=A0A553V5Q4_9DEIO|nr:hypothetical protein [Deinococcus detaillensis]TSA87789.1 hypothetical protein FNU79_00580 [Deinococcus detaillensis]
MSLPSQTPAPTLHTVQTRWALHDFWASCLETGSLLRQGVTRPVLLVWALLLGGLTVLVLSGS